MIRYYQLNPAVFDLTSRHFTFLKESKAKVDVLLGDGRLVLERQLEANDRQTFDVLVLEAFRGASPPMHLMTKEAFAIYFGHLAENGILAVNFSSIPSRSRRCIADLQGSWAPMSAGSRPRQTESMPGPDRWPISRRTGFFEAPIVRRAVSSWRDDGKSEIMWTDQDSNLMSIVNWSRP